MPTKPLIEGQTKGRGRWDLAKGDQIEDTVDSFRLKGYSITDIVEKTNYTKELVNQKLTFLEKRDEDVGNNTNLNAKKRELDLQYLQLIKELKEWTEDLDSDQIKNKIECQKLIKEIITERSKLWSIDGKVTSSANIRMNNVENVILGGNLSKKQLNVIGDIIAGKIKPEEIGEGENATIDYERDVVGSGKSEGDSIY